MKTSAQTRPSTAAMVIVAVAWLFVFVQDLVAKRHRTTPPPAAGALSSAHFVRRGTGVLINST